MSEYGGKRLDGDGRLGLIARVAEGDSEAFASLYDDVAPSAYGIIRRVLRDEAQSDEVVQEVMVEVWRTAARYDGARGSVAAWIATIAHRRAVDRVRSEQAFRDRAERDAALNPPAAVAVDDQVVDTMSEQSEGARVRAALEALTPVQRQSVELAYWGGHTHAEVASILDIPLGTVKTRIRDGLIRLRDTLGADDG